MRSFPIATRRFAAGLATGVLVLATALTAIPGTAADRSARSAAELMDVVMWNREPVGGPFTLTDHTGRTRRDTDFRGKLMLVYFGFTLCPDVCPTDLAQIAEALRSLGPAADGVAPLFITLDPERDTVALLSQYVPAFDKRMVGLTGTPAAIAQVAAAYKVYHAKVANPGGSRYTIDHSSFIYLMDRDGKHLGFIPPSTPAARIAATLKPFLGATPPRR